MRSAECGVRSAECGSAECGVRKCGVWKMQSVENAECGKCGVWKMLSVENAECGKCGVYKKAIKKFCLTWVVNSLCRIQAKLY